MPWYWSILWAIIQKLGPVLADFLAAKLAEFAKKNPKYADYPEKGLTILSDLGLSVVAITSEFKFPDNVMAEARNVALREEGIRLLTQKANERGLVVGENDVRRTIEEAVTAFKNGKRARGL